MRRAKRRLPSGVTPVKVAGLGVVGVEGEDEGFDGLRKAAEQAFVSDDARPNTPMLALRQLATMLKQDPAHCRTCKCEMNYRLEAQPDVVANLKSVALIYVPPPRVTDEEFAKSQAEARKTLRNFRRARRQAKR